MRYANPFQQGANHEESFWPSFTDIMMVIVMIFMLVVVAVVISNTQLMDQLRNSVAAEQQASQLAEFTLQENATLEEQLEYFKRQLSATEMELLQTKAEREATQEALVAARNQVDRLQDTQAEQQAVLGQRDQQVTALRTDLAAQQRAVTALQAELEQVRRDNETEQQQLSSELQQTQAELEDAQTTSAERETVIAELRANMESSQQDLASLKVEYEELDEKYQKLIKPSRSSKNKTVVEVTYRRSGYRIRPPDSANYRNVSRSRLESQLSDLKAEHGDDLYVKIIIPENSGLSYNEAWVFTRDMLNKYDYYYQDSETVGRQESDDS